MEVLEARRSSLIPVPAPSIVEVDERAARATLRDQIARLEKELASAFVAAYPRQGIDWSVPARRGPRILSLGDLEALRDDLSDRVRDARLELAERAEAESDSRRLIEHMMLEPGRFKWVRVSNQDIGEPGCRHWHVRPQRGIVGMFMGWWQVKLSSGCPLATGPRLAAAPRRFPA